jgi:hypothetical protein
LTKRDGEEIGPCRSRGDHADTIEGQNNPEKRSHQDQSVTRFPPKLNTTHNREENEADEYIHPVISHLMKVRERRDWPNDGSPNAEKEKPPSYSAKIGVSL